LHVLTDGEGGLIQLVLSRRRGGDLLGFGINLPEAELGSVVKTFDRSTRPTALLSAAMLQFISVRAQVSSSRRQFNKLDEWRVTNEY
jgi:hypothetical protein